MDYSILYLIAATVFLLFIFSLIIIRDMDQGYVKTSLTVAQAQTEEENLTNPNPNKTAITISCLSVGTVSAAILGTTLFLYVNFDNSINSNLVITVSESLDTITDKASTSYNYFKLLSLLLSFIVIISVKPYILKETGLLILLMVAGILLMATSSNFISFYLALELISLSSYILVSTTINSRNDNLPGLSSTLEATKLTPPISLVKLKSNNSIVAGLNYFLLSALSSGLLVLGISLIYYSTGELDFYSLARIFSSISIDSSINNSQILETNMSMFSFTNEPAIGSGIGMCLVMTFVLFKLGASPFHYWVADVYEKVSIFVNYFLIVVAKLAMLFALMKLEFALNLPLVENFILVAAVSSLVIGSLAGLVQTKLRRLMAFSSINHVGYILLAYCFSLTKKNTFFCASDCQWFMVADDTTRNLNFNLPMIITEFSKISIASLWLYVTIYSLSTVCFFAILSLTVENDNISKQNTTNNISQSDNITISRFNLDNLINNLKASPIFISASLTITLLSLAGVPPLAGFIAKFAIFWQVLDSGNWLLATVAVLCSVIAAIYYLRIVAFLYFFVKEKNHNLELNNISLIPIRNNDNYISSVTFLTALIIATITIILIVFPILNPSFIFLYMNGS